MPVLGSDDAPRVSDKQSATTSFLFVTGTKNIVLTLSKLVIIITLLT